MKMEMKAVKSLLAAAVAAAGLAVFAKPSVEISNVSLADTRDGKVSYTYTVSGDFEGKEYDLHIKVSAANGTKSAVVTHESVTAGTVNTNVDVKALLGKAYPHVTFFAELKKPQMGGVQLWAGGPIWAECNIGAESPEDPGYYFWWGDTVGYVRNAGNNAWVSSQDGTTTIEFNAANQTARKTYDLSISALKSGGWIGEDSKLLPTNDAARVQLKGDWRMPTDAEMMALHDNCDFHQTTTNGVVGFIVTGKAAGYSSKSIFLPYAGYGLGNTLYYVGTEGHVWSSVPYAINSNHYAWILSFSIVQGKPNLFPYTNIDRYCAMPIRAVRDAE